MNSADCWMVTKLNCLRITSFSVHITKKTCFQSLSLPFHVSPAYISKWNSYFIKPFFTDSYNKFHAFLCFYVIFPMFFPFMNIFYTLISQNMNTIILWSSKTGWISKSLIIECIFYVTIKSSKNSQSGSFGSPMKIAKSVL